MQTQLATLPLPVNDNALTTPIYAQSDIGTGMALMFWDMVNDAWDATYYVAMIDQAEAYADRLLDIVGIKDEQLSFALHSHVFAYYGKLMLKPHHFECEKLLIEFTAEILNAVEANEEDHD